ncbi:MAG: hypothetical protein JEY99_03840 [Spirochaetales bacterium]|nr:hypothetical protein [Spirochaetales bacterium]
MGTKKLCKWEKADREKKLEKLKSLVNNPQYVCVKCGRAANEKEIVCKPEKI